MGTSLTSYLCQLSLCCLPVDTACSLFSVTSFLVSAFGLFTLLGPGSSANTIMVEVEFDAEPETWDEDSASIGQAIYVVVLFLHIFAISSFVFSALLVYGTEKRHCGFLKAYMAYGAIMTAVMMMGVTYCYFTSWLLTDEACLIGLISCFIYMRLLFMVRQTHDLYLSEKTRDRAHLLPLCKTA